MATFYNQATLSYNGNTTNSNIAQGELLEVLSATKTAVLAEYSANRDVTYIINIVNSGAGAYSNLTVRDDLGAYTFNGLTLVPLDYVDGSIRYYVNGVLQAAPTVTAAPELVLTGINVPAGGVATIVYTARANSFAPVGIESSIVNTAVISGSGLAADIKVSETVYPVTEAQLTISKSICPAVVTENSRVTYTFIIQNLGNIPVELTDDTILTDVFDPVLTDLAVTFNDAAWTEGTDYTYVLATGTFTTLPGRITVPAATYAQNTETGVITVRPGVSVLTVTGTI